ncbi:MAG: metal-sensitive transcriptional regulator [Bdellovibrio sp.]|nr:metal-sensitive transcriptional regulator [Bdellovibrio sp.]
MPHIKKAVAKNRKDAIVPKPPHDHSAELRRLSRIKGQVEGIERMIIEKRYCPEIVIQIKAVRSALRMLEANIVEGHMRHCVSAAIKSRDPLVAQEKLEEILLLMKGQG